MSSRASSAHRELFEEAWQEDGAQEIEDDEEVANDAAFWSRSTSKNPATGQWATLGSLSYQWEHDEDGDEDYDSVEEDAMSYLRAVR